MSYPELEANDAVILIARYLLVHELSQNQSNIPATSNQIAANTGFSKQLVRRVLGRLADQGLVVLVPRAVPPAPSRAGRWSDGYRLTTPGRRWIQSIPG